MGKYRNQQIDNPSPRENDNERGEIEPAQVDSGKQTDQITGNGSILARDSDHMIHCLTTVGRVEGHHILPSQNKTTKHEHVIPQLVVIEEEPKVRGLLIIPNAVDGDVEAGLAIVELMAGMKKPTVSLVLGGGYSIRVLLAVAAKYPFIVQSVSMTIYSVRMSGLVLGVFQTLECSQRMQERATRFVTQNSKMSPERFYEFSMNTQELVMDVGTVLTGSDVVEEGLIDSVGVLPDAPDCLRSMIDENRVKEKKIKPHSTRKSPKSAKDTK